VERFAGLAGLDAGAARHRACINGLAADRTTGIAWSGPRFFALKSSGERSNGPSDAAHHRGTARHHRQSQSSRLDRALQELELARIGTLRNPKQQCRIVLAPR
jgi:hypothetical protein